MGLLFSTPAVVAVGILYPALCTFQVLEGIDAPGAMSTVQLGERKTQWLMYWIVFAVLHTLETQVLYVVVEMLPFYALLKIAFLAWLQLPQTEGARFIYGKYVAPRLH
eukprot:PhM_4_TR15284/c0_g1_i1/m.3099/K17338/REEP1_2_3_4; receptor expression-enhancing protein 1/2/3/4